MPTQVCAKSVVSSICAATAVGWGGGGARGLGGGKVVVVEVGVEVGVVLEGVQVVQVAVEVVEGVEVVAAVVAAVRRGPPASRCRSRRA